MNSGCKPVALGIAKILALFFSITSLLAGLFEFQFSLFFGPMIDVLVFLALMGLGFVFSIVFLVTNGFSKTITYIPILIWVSGIALSFTGLVGDLSHRFHYWNNKSNLEAIDLLSQEAGIHEMSDFLRYSKRLNEAYIGNGEDYRNNVEIEKAFGDYIREQKLDLTQVVELRKRMEKSNIISLVREEGLLILTVDGFVDNEYGYLKTFGKKLNVGESIPPYGFGIVRLISLGDDWYFFYST